MDYLAQPGNAMFERNIAIIASRKKEVRLFSDSFVYEGFLCGLDAEWIQIYGHEEMDKEDSDTKWRFMLVSRKNVSAIGPTGRDLEDYDAETRKWINDKISVFADGVASKYVALRRGGKNDKREDA